MKLKRVYTSHFPFATYTAITFYPFVFIKMEKAEKYTPTVARHEMTHAKQQVEMAWILFFIIYIIEWIIKIPICCFDFDKAYRSISFEQEAHYNQGKTDYNDIRKHFAWIKYIFKLYNKK